MFHDPLLSRRINLADGTQLACRGFIPHIVYDGQVCCCISEPKVNQILTDQAKRMRALFGRRDT